MLLKTTSSLRTGPVSKLRSQFGNWNCSCLCTGRLSTPLKIQNISAPRHNQKVSIDTGQIHVCRSRSNAQSDVPHAVYTVSLDLDLLVDSSSSRSDSTIDPARSTSEFCPVFF